MSKLKETKDIEEMMIQARKQLVLGISVILN